MSQSRSGNCWKLGLASVLAIGGVLVFGGNYALSEMRSNGTPVGESSVVKSKPINNHTINQVNGRANCKANLFKSVKQFSVPTSITAYFNNAADINNISWVTGKSFFDIDGTFQTNGTANLFLLNSDRKLQHSDTVVDQQIKYKLRAILGQELLIACDCWCDPPGRICCC